MSLAAPLFIAIAMVGAGCGGSSSDGTGTGGETSSTGGTTGTARGGTSGATGGRSGATGGISGGGTGGSGTGTVGATGTFFGGGGATGTFFGGGGGATGHLLRRRRRRCHRLLLRRRRRRRRLLRRRRRRHRHTTSSAAAAPQAASSAAAAAPQAPSSAAAAAPQAPSSAAAAAPQAPTSAAAAPQPPSSAAAAPRAIASVAPALVAKRVAQRFQGLPSGPRVGAPSAATVDNRLAVRLDRLRNSYLTIDPRGLGAGRLALATVLLIDLARRFPLATLWYSNEGLLPNHTVLWRPPFPYVFSFFFTASRPYEALIGFGLCGIAYLMLLVGLRTRLAQVASLLAVLSLHGRVLFVQNSGDVVLVDLCIWTSFLPLGRRYSIDSLRAQLRPAPGANVSDLLLKGAAPSERTPVVSWAVLAVVAQLAVIYFLNAAQKNGPTWREGTAVHYILYYANVVTPLGVWARGWVTPRASQLLTWSTRFTEAVLPLLLLTPFAQRQARWLAIALVVALHVGFGLFLDLGIFVPAMLAFAPFLLPASDWDRLERWWATTGLAGPSREKVGRALATLDRRGLLPSRPPASVSPSFVAPPRGMSRARARGSRVGADGLRDRRGHRRQLGRHARPCRAGTTRGVRRSGLPSDVSDLVAVRTRRPHQRGDRRRRCSDRREPPRHRNPSTRRSRPVAHCRVTGSLRGWGTTASPRPTCCVSRTARITSPRSASGCSGIRSARGMTRTGSSPFACSRSNRMIPRPACVLLATRARTSFFYTPTE